MLKAAAEQPGSHVVHSLYALGLIDAEGGHYQEVGCLLHDEVNSCNSAYLPVCLPGCSASSRV